MPPTRLTLAVAALALFAHAAPLRAQPAVEKKIDKKVEKKTDQQLLQGVWTIVMLEGDGKPSLEKYYVGNTFEFKADKAYVVEAQHEPLEFTFELAAGPGDSVAGGSKHIDLIMSGKRSLGIYQLDGDDLRLNLTRGDKRPTAFKTAPGDKTEVFTLKRGAPGDLLAWNRFKAVEGFSVDMPAKPDRRLRSAKSAEGPVAATFYVARTPERLSYMAVTMRLPYEAKEKTQIDKALDQFTAEMVAEFGKPGTADVKKSQAFEKDKYVGRETTILLKIPGAPRPAGARVRTFFVEGRLFALMVVGVEDSISQKNIKRFWDSFRLDPKP